MMLMFTRRPLDVTILLACFVISLWFFFSFDLVVCFSFLLPFGFHSYPLPLPSFLIVLLARFSSLVIWPSSSSSIILFSLSLCGSNALIPSLSHFSDCRADQAAPPGARQRPGACRKTFACRCKCVTFSLLSFSKSLASPCLITLY